MPSVRPCQQTLWNFEKPCDMDMQQLPNLGQRSGSFGYAERQDYICFLKLIARITQKQYMVQNSSAGFLGLVG